MFYQLPPAGNPVLLSRQAGSLAFSFFPSYKKYFYDSGTAALAAAICAAIKYRGLVDAEVILPAYGCPDLVSAVIYAGAKPVLVDLEAERPWLDLSALADAVNDKTVAIVAVNLFGIAERWPQLREISKKNNIVLIEDSAQYFPGEDESQDWHGDLVVLSFGRGKPVSLLGGGAALSENKTIADYLPAQEKTDIKLKQRIVFSVKARLYNILLSPYVYWLPQALPFLHLGETRYHELQRISSMDEIRHQLLGANVKRYQQDEKAVLRSEKISSILQSIDQLIDLPRICGMKNNRRLLRYPVLLDADKREQVFQKLRQAGLGASRMYPASLPEIEGLQGLFGDKKFPQAEAFASRLITLPTHEKVNDGVIEKIKILLTE